MVLCKEACLPYDRTKLSKAMSITIDRIQLRPTEFYQKHSIDMCLGKEVTELDATSKSITINDGTQIHYDCCFVAPGGSYV